MIIQFEGKLNCYKNIFLMNYSYSEKQHLSFGNTCFQQKE